MSRRTRSPRGASNTGALARRDPDCGCRDLETRRSGRARARGAAARALIVRFRVRGKAVRDGDRAVGAQHLAVGRRSACPVRVEQRAVIARVADTIHVRVVLLRNAAVHREGTRVAGVADAITVGVGLLAGRVSRVEAPLDVKATPRRRAIVDRIENAVVVPVGDEGADERAVSETVVPGGRMLW